MELKIRKNGEIYIIDVNGEMDLYNSYKLKELVMKMLEKSVNLTYTEATVKILSALNAENEAQLEALADELCK